MNPTPHTRRPRRRHRGLLVAGLAVVVGALLAACSGSSAASPSTNDGAAAAGGPVLPVTANPIHNSSTVQALTVDSVLVENNVDSTGKVADDHLEIALTNTGSAELTEFQVSYTFTDPATRATESYYAVLPADFTIPVGGHRVAHFDNSGGVDHFPVDQYSLYYTDTASLEVSVTVSATDTAVQTVTLTKDAGGAETAD
jgi:hypothetical protein